MHAAIYLTLGNFKKSGMIIDLCTTFIVNCIKSIWIIRQDIEWRKGKCDTIYQIDMADHIMINTMICKYSVDWKHTMKCVLNISEIKIILTYICINDKERKWRNPRFDWETDCFSNWIRTFWFPFYAPAVDDRGHIVFVLSVILLFRLVIVSFCPPLWNFNLDNNFWQWVLELWYFTWIFPVVRPFRGYHIFITLWPWPWSLTHFLTTLTLLIIFEQWVLELFYFTWVFLVIRLFRGYHHFWPCDLDLGVWPI